MSIVDYGSAEATVARMPSPEIWKDCPAGVYQENPEKGNHVFEDFRNSIVNTSNTTVTDFTSGVGAVLGDMNLYAYSEGDKVVDVALQADNDGVLMLATDGTDADVGAVTSGSNVAGVWKTPGIGAPKKFWFEARLKVNTITDADLGFFIGLAQPGEAKNAGGAMTAGGAAMSDVDYIGFAVLSGDNDALTAVYNEAGAGTAQSSAAATLVANTYVRVGFKVVIESSSAKVKFFVNGVDLGADKEIDIGSTNADFPSDTDMDILASLVAESGASDGDNIKIDWIRVAQEF